MTGARARGIQSEGQPHLWRRLTLSRKVLRKLRFGRQPSASDATPSKNEELGRTGRAVAENGFNEKDIVWNVIFTSALRSWEDSSKRR